MFSSLASFLFGSNTNCETNSDTTATATAIAKNEKPETRVNLVDDDNLIEVTSLTPSVTGAGAGDRGQRAIKRGRNRRNNTRQQHKREGTKAPLPLKANQANIENCDDEEFDEDDWFIVEKEEEEQDVSITHSDFERENVPVVEVAKTIKPVNAVAAHNLGQQRRVQHINSHSLYSGERPQKPRNYVQKTRNHTSKRPSSGLSVSTLSPSRTVNHGRNGCGHEASADGGMTRSLYVAPVLSPKSDEQAVAPTSCAEVINKMEESWFVTPPPCFTSVGPVNMPTSPYENLLIEHPSMSVYHSIRTAEETAATFVKLDMVLNESNKVNKMNKMPEKPKTKVISPKKAKENNSQTVTVIRSPGYHLDRQTVVQLKQEAMARNVQKIQNKNEGKDIFRTAVKRANKAREIQSKNYTKRRSDRQHSKIFSNANNNRKSNCY